MSSEIDQQLLGAEIMKILNHLLRQIMTNKIYNNLACASTILDFSKRIDTCKIKIANTVARIYKVLEPYDELLMKKDTSFIKKNVIIELLPGINIIKIYLHPELDSASQQVVLDYLVLLKCYANMYFGKKVEETKALIPTVLGTFTSKTDMSKNDIIKARDEIKKMFGTSGSTAQTVASLVDQISDKLIISSEDENGLDFRSLMMTAVELAQKNKQHFIDGKVNISEMTASASNIMKKVYSDPNNNLKEQLGFDPNILLQSLNNPDVDGATALQNALDNIPTEQKSQLDQMLGSLGASMHKK